MSPKNVVLSLVLVAATSVSAVVLASYLCSAAMARAGHASNISKTLANHGVIPASTSPHAGPRRFGLHAALTLPESAAGVPTR
jgi:hypothetical protein